MTCDLPIGSEDGFFCVAGYIHYPLEAMEAQDHRHYFLKAEHSRGSDNLGCEFLNQSYLPRGKKP